MTAAAAGARARVILPAAYPRQAAALYPDARYSIIEGSTKSGKTAGCMVWQLSQMLLRRPGTVHWWVAPVYGQARIAFRRAAKDFRELIASANHSEMRIVLREEYGGSTWSFRSGENPDNLFGEEVESAVIDEASRMREEAWHAVRSTLSTTRGPARVIGNVKGRGNWFYKLARRAEAGEPGYHYAKLTAQDAVDGGVLEQEEVDQARRDLPPEAFGELYECKPADDAYNPFGLANIDAAVGDPGRSAPVVWGLDIARKRDWTVLTGIDARGNVTVCERWQGEWGIIEERISETMRDRGAPRALVLADATGVGDAIVGNLQRKGLNVEPYVFTSAKKQDLMQGLRVALMDRALTIPDGFLRAELENFEYRSEGQRVVYSAPEGMHDDAVCSLALAVHLGTVLTSKVRTRSDAAATPLEMPAPARARVRNARKFR